MTKKKEKIFPVVGAGIKARKEGMTTHARDLDGQNLREINRCREAMGLSPIRIVMRNCLRCSKQFKSKGRGNFMCDNCARYSDTDGDKAS